MTTAVATTQQDSTRDLAAVMEQVVSGNLERLTSAERVTYVSRLCESLGLNPMTGPIQILTLKGKVVLYMRKDGTEQLRRIHNVSLRVIQAEAIEADLYVVRVQAFMRGGRVDESTGAVSLAGLKGEERANALMKAETKAKRRATLSICGLGFLDESEVADIPEARQEPPVQVQQVSTPNKPAQQTAKTMPISDGQIELIHKYAEFLGISDVKLGDTLQREFGQRQVSLLNADQAAQVVTRMQKAAASKK